MARAYCAIANGGMLLRPRIVRAILDERRKRRLRYGSEVEGRVISASRRRRRCAAFLRTVVARGTGNPTAQVPGYTTAGKTGTAQVVENGAYVPGAYIASFIGYDSGRSPRYVILVKIDGRAAPIYGSIVAAPAFPKSRRWR